VFVRIREWHYSENLEHKLLNLVVVPFDYHSELFCRMLVL